jgi:hypothetical protein
MILSATLKRESIDGDAVRYVDSYGGDHSFLSGAVVLKASDLPDPPPALLRVDLSWYQAPRDRAETGTGETSAQVSSHVGRDSIGQGDRVTVIKSRISGVQNPPEWLEQHLGRSGVVLWITAGGANVDLGDDTVWFAYDELELVP